MRPRYRNGFRHHFQSCNTSLGALQARFPDISVSLRAPHVDSMMVSSVEAQLRGLEVVDVSGKVNAAHIGSISSMRAQKIRTVTARLRATGMLHLSGGRELWPSRTGTCWPRRLAPGFSQDARP